MICERMNIQPRLVFSGEVRPGDAQRRCADISRLKGLEYRPRVRLADGLADRWPGSGRLALRFPAGGFTAFCFSRVGPAPKRCCEMRLDCEPASLWSSFGDVARARPEWSAALRHPAPQFGSVKRGEARVETAGRFRVIAREPADALVGTTTADRPPTIPTECARTSQGDPI